MNLNTVEKIGGTTMSRLPEMIDTHFKKLGKPEYNRVIVVSAFGGMTDLLLEHKHSGEPGVYSLFSEGENEDEWRERLSDVAQVMRKINESFFESSELRAAADAFVDERIADAMKVLEDVQHVCSFGSFALEEYLLRVRELLSSIGEAHSAHNATLLLQSQGVNARFTDLTGWRDTSPMNLEERIAEGFKGVDFDKELPIVTGYAQCTEGLVKRYARGYTEITMGKIAELTKPNEAIIHKEYHLSSADPRIVGVEASIPIGRTNYDVADQLANLGMEAIHPGAASILRRKGIPLRVKHAFEPEHNGTLINSDYLSSEPRVEIIAGRRGVMAIEIFDQDMIEKQLTYESQVIDLLRKLGVRSVGKDVNANSLVHYVSASLRSIKRLVTQLSEQFPAAEITTQKLAFVCAIGTDMDMPGILGRCSTALGKSSVAIRSVSQPLRGVDARFVVEEKDYETAVRALHESIVGEVNSETIAA
ncbi:MAG: aspartate kinase [Pseudohongiella sp.]|nr:MAG: aspartate kinase [Pseudohongiella sp.]